MIKKYQERKIEVSGNSYYPYKEVLIFDIETRKINIDGDISSDNAEMVIWGAYSYKTGKIYFGKNANFQQLLDKHKIIVGHNIKDFDIPIMEKIGCNFNYKVLVDLLEIIRPPPSKGEKEAMLKKGKKPKSGKGRAKIIGEAQLTGMNDLRFPNFKLATIAKHGHKLFGNHKVFGKFFGEYKDEDFDYDMLQDVKTDEQWRIIKDYLKKDVIVTKNIFEFLEHYFENMAEGLPEKDIQNLAYMRDPTGTYFYKCICHDLNLPFEYGDEIRAKFPGAHVKLPTREKYTPKDGDGYCIDWASQHPHNIWGANLATPATKCKHKVNGVCPNPYKGDGKIFKLTGTYCGCEMGEIEKWLRHKYFKRNEYRLKFIKPNGEELKYKNAKVGDKVYYIDDHKNLITKVIDEDYFKDIQACIALGIDPRQYSIKIIINSGYGVLSSPTFKSTYNPTTGPDTTLMSQQSTGFMDKWMSDNEYIVTYGDSVSGESYIHSKKYGRIKIEDYFNLYNNDNKKNIMDSKDIAITNDKSLSANENGIIKWDNCNYIMRHKVKKDMYRINVTNSEYIDVTEDHSILIEKDNKLVEIKPTSLKVGDKVLFMNSKPINKSKDIEDDMDWFLGYWIADGSYTKNNYVNISSGDKEVENIIKKVCNKWNCNYSLGKNGFDYKIHCTKLVSWMKSKEFIGLSSTKRIPDYIKNSTLRNKSNFINGYFCGDGTVLSNGYIRASSINIELLKDFQELLMECKIISKIITETKPNYYQTDDKYYNNGSISKHLIISKHDAHTFKSKIGFYFKRKHDRITFSTRNKPSFGDMLKVRVQKIKKLKPDNIYVYDLCMQKHSNFIANNILVHNTDSLYIMDPFNDKEKMIKTMADGVKQIKDVLPFVDSTYNMDVDAEFSHIFFFQDNKDKAKRFKKKNYIYILQPKNGKTKVKIMGLPLLKSNSPKLAKKIYTEYLENEIIKTKDIKFEKEYIRQLIYLELEKDINILVTNLKVKPAKMYATESQMQAQASLKYLGGKGGNLKLIKHKRKGFGFGLGKHYCLLNEAKELNIREFDLETVWKTLDPFIKKDKQLSLTEW